MLAAVIADVFHTEDRLRSFGSVATFVVFAVIFAESGLMVGFFLPGDSLLFIAGLLSGSQLAPLPLLIIGCGSPPSSVTRWATHLVIGWARRCFSRPWPFAVQAEVPEAGRGLLRASRVEDDHPGPVHTDRPHLRPDRGRGLTHEVPDVRDLQHHRRRGPRTRRLTLGWALGKPFPAIGQNSTTPRPRNHRRAVTHSLRDPVGSVTVEAVVQLRFFDTAPKARTIQGGG